MAAPIRSSDEISQLYKQLADQISAENEAGVRRVYKELLRSGEPVGAIVGIAMSSVQKVGNRRENGGSEPTTDKPSGALRVPVKLRQSASEVTPRQIPCADVHIDRSEPTPVGFTELRGADGDDGPLKVLPTQRRAQAEPTQVTPDAEAPEPAAVDGAIDPDIHHEPFTDTADVTSEAETPNPAAVDEVGDLDVHHEPVTDTAHAPPPISPTGVAHSPRPSSDLQLVMRLAMRRAQTEPTPVTSDADAPEPAAVDGAGDSDIHHEPITDTPHDPAGVAQSPSVNPGLEAAGRLATRSIIVLAAALAATVGISLPLREHRPADKDRAAALQPAVVSPPTLAFAAGAAGLSRAALSPTITVASAGFSEEKRPTVVMPGVAPSDKAAVIAAVPAIIPAGAPVSPADVSALLRRGDALLATGDIVSARLFYEQAAMAGDATAALWLGESYDSRFLAVAGLHGLHSDPALAARWYRRARELGASEAEILLKSTEDRPD